MLLPNNAGRFPGKAMAALVILAAFIGVLYFPARHLPFLEDQMIYMADLNGDYSLASGLGRWDYSNTRLYWKGDQSLSRPLFMGWIGIQAFFFGNHYPYWDITHVALHVLVCFCLFLLFSQSVNYIIALLFSLGFAVSPHLIGLTTDSHLGGYLWAYSFFILFMIQIFDMEKSGEAWPDARIYLLAGSMALCVLFFEIFNVFIFMMLLYLIGFRVWERKPGFSRKQLVILFLPFALFTAIYVFHVMGAERFSYTGQSMDLSVRLRSQGQCLADAVRTFKDWVFLLMPRPEEPRSFFEIAGGAILLFSLFSIRSFKKAALILLLGVSLCLYVLLVCTIRPLPHIHHYYFFLLLIGLILFYSLDFKKFPVMISILLIAVTAAGAETSWRQLKSAGEVNKPRYNYFSQIERFVDHHRKEPGFSFRIENIFSPGLDPMHPLKPGYGDQPRDHFFQRRDSEILFARYYDPFNPLYVLRWEDRSFRVISQKRKPGEYALKQAIFGLKNISERPFDQLANRIPDGYPGTDPGCILMPDLNSGVLLTSAAPRKARKIEISTDSWDSYRLEFYLDGKKKGELSLPAAQPAKGGIVMRTLPMPENMQEKEFNQILVLPVEGDGIYSLAYLILDPVEKEALEKKYGVSWVQEVDLARTAVRIPDGTPGNRGDFLTMPDVHSGILIRMPAPREALSIEISTDSYDAYQLEFYLNGTKKGELFLPVVQPPAGGTFKRVLSIPENMQGRKFDQILVKPVSGDGVYSLAYLILDPSA